MNRRMRARLSLRNFIASESSGGLILMGVAALALVIANSPLAPAYFGALKTYVGGLSILHWINDALMAVFFLLVGLEIKREMVEGRLSTWSQRALPGLAAAGGMIGPALVYVALNWQTPETLRGWAIPAATDIAFALGVLSLIGPRVPISLKVFLTALAIIDDLGAVIIIALFYTANLSLGWLALAAAVLAVLFGLGRMGERRLAVYLALGALLWFFVLRSGVHATLAGVLLAMTIPIRGRGPDDHPPLHVLEHGLAPWVAFMVVPIFGFANAGVSFSGMSLETLAQPVTLGIALGLFIGKQVGIFLITWLAHVLRVAPKPEQATWLQIYGVSLICGIGFTMSLFIGLLAFDSSQALQDQTKVGVLLGSLLSGVLGAVILTIAPPYRPKA